MNPVEFSQRVLNWFERHGRTDLPWQREPTPYRVWISEIMLQQTQVTTVIPYYQRFMTRFPDVLTLAAGSLDEVLHLWSGLGYYARARNLWQAAVIVRDRHGGELPLDVETLHRLPGIGRSTAGAILALSTGQRQPILDGNVKRVLARYRAIEGWPGQAAVLAELWIWAERYTPNQRVQEYTQAMMDLGALICTRHRPRCEQCPLAVDCLARARGRQAQLPAPKPRRELPVRQTRMLLLCDRQGRVLLEKRPPTGVWGGLWSFPECPSNEEVTAWCRMTFGLGLTEVRPWSTVRHTFSHFHLDIAPVHARVVEIPDKVMEAERLVWYNTRAPDPRGLAAPVRRLLAVLTNE